MPVLGIRHHRSDGAPVAELTWGGEGPIRVSVPFVPAFDRFDLEDVRWYHENYRENWGVSSDSVVQRIRRAERNLGETLHAALFHGAAAPLAERVRRAGADLRVEIRDEVHGAAIPWELVADPRVDEPLALTASGFVRVLPGGMVAADVVTDGTADDAEAEHRLLLLISRPDGGADVGYWSVAYDLWRELAALPRVKVDVLRPPTFDALEQRLDDATRSGTPYSAVHFDGHGAVVDPFGGDGTRGYLVFETAGRQGPEFVDGSTLGRTLAAAGVRLFSMNACRSGDSEGGDRHLRIGREPLAGQPSVVEEVLAAGLPSCVGMRQEIYAGTASRFFRTFYPEFFGGAGAGEAARVARRRLRVDPLSVGAVRHGSEPVDDWSIPVVGERVVVHLRSEPAAGTGSGAQPAAAFPERLSASAVVGSDRAVLMLEDLFARTSVALVTGLLFAGKSRVAIEYARWLSATSPTPCPVTYLDLATHGTPAGITAVLLSEVAVPGGDGRVDVSRCAELLSSRGGILVLDQADGLAPQTSAFLGDLVTRLDGACRVLVTARAGSLSWLPGASSVTPSALSQGARAELARHWAQERGVPFDRAAFHPLLFFSGGLPGVLVTLLGAAHEAVTSGAAQAQDISFWLHSADWDNLGCLARDPGPGLPSIESLAETVAGDLSAVCDETELAMVRVFSRFQVCLDEQAAAGLWTAVSGTKPSAGASTRVIEKLRSSGLATPVVGAVRPSWFLHPLLKLVASRLGPAVEVDDDDVQDAIIEAVSQTSADAVARFRSDVAATIDTLANHKQNIADALHFALERRRTPAAARLTEALCIYCRFVADVGLAGRVLNRALPHFVDVRTGALRPECAEIALRVWDEAVWLSPTWPRNHNPMREQPVDLMPPDEDHYAAGLWLRAVGDFARASAAFRRELETPRTSPRWAPGDLECQLSETVYDPSRPETWPEALELSRRSYAVRLSDDSPGRAWSRISQARLRMVSTLNRIAATLDVTVRIEISPKQLAALEEAAVLLREADAEPGGRSAENSSQAAMVWSRITLARGDLTSAISYFEAGAQTMIELQESSIWTHYWHFAINLLQHGWTARSYELAVNAFQFAMQAGDHELATRIRRFCEDLEDAHPELRDE